MQNSENWIKNPRFVLFRKRWCLSRQFAKFSNRNLDFNLVSILFPYPSSFRTHFVADNEFSCSLLLRLKIYVNIMWMLACIRKSKTIYLQEKSQIDNKNFFLPFVFVPFVKVNYATFRVRFKLMLFWCTCERCIMLVIFVAHEGERFFFVVVFCFFYFFFFLPLCSSKLRNCNQIFICGKIPPNLI